MAVPTEEAEKLVRHETHRQQQRGEQDVACTRGYGYVEI